MQVMEEIGSLVVSSFASVLVFLLSLMHLYGMEGFVGEGVAGMQSCEQRAELTFFFSF
jgi:hypothetical protein